ncbi:MAG: PP2C family serine/threonine-protein phosphatase, partial [Myxococcota bacterium]
MQFVGSPTEPELTALERKLDFEPEYRLLDLEVVQHPREITAVDRYQVGDLARVPRTSGKWSLGVVSEVKPGESVTVLLRASSGLSTKELDARLLATCNPLKIGDFFYLEGKPFRVAGLADDGEFMVLSRSGQRVDPREVRSMMEDVIHGDSERTVQIQPRPRIVPAPQARPLSTARPMQAVPYVPIESILEANSQYGLIAGNKETPTVYNLRSPVADAALHTHRGHNYKNWNEDGGALFADGQGRLFVGVFDQAGGEGSDEQARGAATAVAGEMLFDEMQKIAATRGDRDEAEAALIRAAVRAHEAILERGKGEVTTFIGAMIDESQAVIVNVGDSGVMQFDRAGKHLRSTEVQGVGRL